MADGEIIRAGDLMYQRAHQVRRDDHVSGGENRGDDEQFNTGQPGVHAGGNKHIREPVQHMPGQKNGLPFCEPRNQQVDQERNQHHNADLCAINGHVDVFCIVCRGQHGAERSRKPVN
ncbi:hypothetical protein SDC9_159451 [bioreactor metagenome]|uniref:Uncharacterized protein n=1 Tax=bioreactor metagenome TaxID=1076179 RepID=A0A645FFL5_9ZZZZ